MDKSTLLGSVQETAEVELPGKGTVKVRGLTRYETALMTKKCQGDNDKIERFILATGMVDPQLTEDEVEAWQQIATAGEILKVATRINQLSGFSQGAAKSPVAGDGDD
jgi:hypothetical protein